MQRKNNILKSKNAIAMIMAVVTIMIISTIMLFSLKLSSFSTKETTDTYLYQQAVILSRSAAEYAILRASLAQPCSINKIDFRYNNTFDVNITMRYISVDGSTCHDNNSGWRYATTSTPQSDGTIIMDISVSCDISTEPIRYFRRTIQKL
jgi:hypothetical protein